MEQNGHVAESAQLPRWLPNGDIEDEWGVIPKLPHRQLDPITNKLAEETPELRALRRNVISRSVRAFSLLPDDDPPGVDEELERIFGPN